MFIRFAFERWAANIQTFIGHLNWMAFRRSVHIDWSTFLGSYLIDGRWVREAGVIYPSQASQNRTLSILRGHNIPSLFLVSTAPLWLKDPCQQRNKCDPYTLDTAFWTPAPISLTVLELAERGLQIWWGRR